MVELRPERAGIGSRLTANGKGINGMNQIRYLPLALSALLAGLPLCNAAEQQGAALAETSVMIYFYNLSRSDVVQPAVDGLAPLVRGNDVFVLVSGNHSGQPDIRVIARWAENLHQRCPQTAIWVLTSGLTNVKALAAARKTIPAYVSGIVYDYEPNWDNEPEFSADFAKTIDNFTQVVKAAHDGSFALAGTPSGRYLLRAQVASLGWDYGTLAQASGADGMQVQTQGYCKKGLEDFKAALAKLKQQQLGAGLPLDRMYPQITVGPSGGNAIPAPQAVACVREARHFGFTRIALWFSPTRFQGAVDFLKGLGRQ
jgi:hypothetical protein